MKVSISTRVTYDSLKRITLINSKGVEYTIAFNAVTKFKNGNYQFALFHKKRAFKVVQNWFYDPVRHHIKRTVTHNQSGKWKAIRNWNKQNEFLKMSF